MLISESWGHDAILLEMKHPPILQGTIERTQIQFLLLDACYPSLNRDLHP